MHAMTNHKTATMSEPVVTQSYQRTRNIQVFLGITSFEFQRQWTQLKKKRKGNA
jgi:hypothetical protein